MAAPSKQRELRANQLKQRHFVTPPPMRMALLLQEMCLAIAHVLAVLGRNLSAATALLNLPA
jgi:hypothetical protein